MSITSSRRRMTRTVVALPMQPVQVNWYTSSALGLSVDRPLSRDLSLAGSVDIDRSFAPVRRLHRRQPPQPCGALSTYSACRTQVRPSRKSNGYRFGGPFKVVLRCAEFVASPLASLGGAPSGTDPDSADIPHGRD